MKTYIFLTKDGSCQDGTGEYVENIQVLGCSKGIDALDAYNNALEFFNVFCGYFDTCFCQELVSENVCGNFDLIGDTE